MKNKVLYILIFFATIFFSCSNSSNSDFYIENIKNDFFVIQRINKQNSNIIHEFEWIKIYSPRVAKIYLNKINQNDSKADSIYNLIENIKLFVLDDFTDTILNLEKLKLINKNEKVFLSENEHKAISNGLIEYRKLIFENIHDTVSIFKNDFMFDENKVEKILNQISSEVSVLEFISTLSKIQYYIKKNQYNFNYHLYCDIDLGTIKFDKLTPYVIPKSKTINLNNSYNSMLVFGANITKQKSFVILDNKTYKTIECKFFFKEKARKDSGKVEIDAKFQMENFYDGEIIEYPFKIEYEVVE